MRLKTILIISLYFLILQPLSGICETIDWQSYNDGIRQARKENKKVFLHFRTDWCGYCTKMERHTFQDESIAVFLNTHFIAIKVDGDKEKELVKAYKVTGYPDNRFLDEEMEAAYRIPGFVEAPALLFFLEYVQTDSFKKMDPMQYYKSR